MSTVTSAEVTDAWSERIWLVDAPFDSSLESFASAADKLAWPSRRWPGGRRVDRGQHLARR